MAKQTIKPHPHSAPGSDYLLSLSSIVGKPIKDVYGYVSGNFGFPVFECTKIVFEDGTWEDLEGEHDIAYIPSPAKHKELKTPALKKLAPDEHFEDPDDEDEDDDEEDWNEDEG